MQNDKCRGTLEACDNDPYVDPETWTSDNPIMGQKHSSQKSKRSSAASSNLSKAQNHTVLQINPTYEQNTAKQQPTVTSINDEKMDQLPHQVVENNKEWTTYVPTTDGSYVPSEGSSPRSSIANEENAAQLKRLSHWSQGVDPPRAAAPLPVMTEEKKPSLPPRAHRIR